MAQLKLGDHVVVIVDVQETEATWIKKGTKGVVTYILESGTYPFRVVLSDCETKSEWFAAQDVAIVNVLNNIKVLE